MKTCLNYTPDFERIASELETNGYYCLHEALNKEFTTSLSSIVDDERRWHHRHESFHNTNAYLVPNLINKSIYCLDLVTDQYINHIASDFFRKGAYHTEESIYQLHLMHGRVLVDQSPPQELHIDSRCCGINPPSHLHFFLYLDDCLEAGQGATQFVPGSHKFDRYPIVDDGHAAVEIYAKASSLVVLNSATYHGSSRKTTMGKRKILTFAYSRWFIRQPFSIPYFEGWPRNLSKEEKNLLGFSNYGTIDNNSRITSRGPLPDLIAPEGEDCNKDEKP